MLKLLKSLLFKLNLHLLTEQEYCDLQNEYYQYGYRDCSEERS